jgi:transcription elongation factor Elf1
MSLSVDSKYIRLLSSRLRNFKQKKDYLWNFSCPVCGDSQTNKTKARGYVFQKGSNLFYRCHNCGISIGLVNLIKSVDASLHKEYVLERYKSGESNNSRSANTILNISPPRFDKVSKQKVLEHSEWVDKLPSGHFCLDYVKGRKIPSEHHDKLLFTQHFKRFATELIPEHSREHYEEKLVDDARLVLPFYDGYNELIAISGRALETNEQKLRYVTVRTNDSQNKLIYGMDRVDLSKTVKIVEGPLDSLFLSNCVASGDANLVLCMDAIEANNFILVFDNEPRNKEIVKMMQNAVNLKCNVVIWPNTVEGKDINEMVMNGLSPDEIEKIISNNSFSGIEAQLKFNMWKKV